MQMKQSLEIFADIVLSSNGEDFSVVASKNSITISMPSLLSGMGNLVFIIGQRRFIEKSRKLDKFLRLFGWTIYLKYGRFKLATLGSKGNFKLMEWVDKIWQSVVKTMVA
jgi:hypothetical protein